MCLKPIFKNLCHNRFPPNWWRAEVRVGRARAHSRGAQEKKRAEHANRYCVCVFSRSQKCLRVSNVCRARTIRTTLVAERSFFFARSASSVAFNCRNSEKQLAAQQFAGNNNYIVSVCVPVRGACVVGGCPFGGCMCILPSH